MCKRIVLFIVSLSFVFGAFAQESDTIPAAGETPAEVPVITYSLSPKKYKIADIKVSGLKKDLYEDFTIIGLSGLSVGDVITVPEPDGEITATVKRFWRHGLFSDVKVLAAKIEGDQIWLEIQLRQRPRISQVNYLGVKKGEREELETRLGFRKGYQVTPNLMDRAKTLIQKYFDGKGFKNVDVDIVQKDDLAHEGEVIVDIHIDKNEKTKINEIIFSGNDAIKASQLRKAMKKTNEKFSLYRRLHKTKHELFSTKKFTTEEYENDKKNLIDKYNEYGYRDAVILSDSVVNVNDKQVNIYLSIEEGRKYYLKDIHFIGNTQYPTDYLANVLQMKPGDVYNQKKLNEHLSTDEESVANVYYNNGYLFFGVDPVEVEAENDSISLEIRIQEGPQATINRIIIEGNDRLYEDVVRRELRTKPGMLFSRDDLIRSVRELAQMGHFDPENMNPQPIPDPESGTVDIKYSLVSKANDQVEFSAGWGQVGVIGKLSLKFTNFSIKNFLNPKTYKGIIPQGDGQTLTLSGQTNGRYYQGYSISFMDPWFGGKRPNTLSISAHYSKQSGVNSDFLSNSMSSYGYSPYGYNQYGYNSSYNYGYDPYNSYELAYDPNQSLELIAVSAGYGKRLNWPDDYFQFMATLSYQVYMLNNWEYYQRSMGFTTGSSHNINIELLLQRSSIDNPLYTRRGSQFSISLSATPPYSLFDGKDYASMSAANRQKLLEYHKWKIRAKVFTPLLPLTFKRTPVLMSRIEYGFLGHYNKNKISPFETFYMGGSGMTGYTGIMANETIALRGYDEGSIAGGGNAPYGYAYTRLGMELRYPFLLEPSSTIYGLAFVEAGNAWGTLKEFNPFALKRSAGVGVRIFLPMIGLMGIDWAYGFDKPDYYSTRGGSQFHFIIGQEF
jgi:outer membrane protein insertion porin family